LENKGDENRNLEEDPFAKLEMRLLGNRDIEEQSFFHVAGGGVDLYLL
jgi:hypothetical protein